MKERKLFGGMDCVHPKGSFFGEAVLNPRAVAPTVSGTGWMYCHDEPRLLNRLEFCRIGSYPVDYEFEGNKPCYLIGMSVPPVMTAQVATRVYEQWLSQ